MYNTIIPITKMHLGNTHNRPGSKLTKPLKIVLHYTANTNKGANAERNRTYYNTTSNTASTQYVVDDKQIVECMPWYEVAWAVGAKSYTTFGDQLRKQIDWKTPNYCTVNIEMCVNCDADWNKVVKNTVSVVVWLLFETGLSLKDVCRHFDITGKICPAMYIDDQDWATINKYIKEEYEAHKENRQPKYDYMKNKAVEILADTLNVRKGPSVDYEQVVKDGKNLAYLQGDVVVIYEVTDEWYRTDDGWISGNKSYVKVVEHKEVIDDPTIILDNVFGTITADKLNVRRQPVNGEIVKTYYQGEVVQLLEDKNGWYRTKDGWISGEFVQRDDSRLIVKFNHAVELIEKETGELILYEMNKPVVVFLNDKKIENGVLLYGCNYLGDKCYVKELFTVV